MMGEGRKEGLFLGLRFLLAGIEEENEKQFVEEIVENGGQICKQYDSSCTHVVIFNLPLNDPICCAARKDGKTLVTDFWITDCLDTDALVDVSNVLYRPLKDIDGIEGSKKLCICLTGYQGFARKNIMRMVEMMGAKFSKPLIGSQVTHLVCYKFEGEKYELAKKTGMALVNHFWLEDSLDSWTLRPVSKYDQSGWEAEILKAQENVVEDSGEDDSVDTQDRVFVKQSSSDKVASSGHAEFLKETNRNLTVDGDLNEGSKSHEESKSRQSLSPPASYGKVRNVGCAVDRITDGPDDIRRLERMSPSSKPSAGGILIDVAPAATDNNSVPDVAPAAADNNSVPDVEQDESTHLYVEEENESDHSCGRTSYEEAKLKSDLLVAEIYEPVDAIATTCQKMEMIDFSSEHKTRQTSCTVEDHSGDKIVETPKTKRRRSSQFMGKEEEPPLESRSPGDEEAKLFDDRVFIKNVPFGSALNLQPTAMPGSNVNQEILAFPAGPCLPVQVAPLEMEHCDSKSSYSKETSAMEISTNESDYVLRHAQDAQGPSTGNLGRADEVGADADVPIVNEEADKSFKTTNVKEKKTALKTNVSGNNALPVTLAEIAQSYKPCRNEKSSQKKKLAVDDKENHVGIENDQATQPKATVRKNETTKKTTESRKASASEPSKMMCFAVGGSTDERTKLHSIIKILGGRISKCRHQWRDEATHVILPGPLRRTEKFLAGAAAGRWILKPEYLEASRKAGKFLVEEAYEWYGEGTNDKGSISLLAPRRWRLSVASSGVGAFHGLRVLFYGECISPPLDTMKRAIKAGSGVVLATAPPYARHLADGVNFAVISPGILKEDEFVEEFLKHGVACVLSEYLVNLVCHPSFPLEQYILYGTEKAVQQHRTDSALVGGRHPSLQGHTSQRNQKAPDAGKTDPTTDNDSCAVCGRLDGDNVMLLCDGKGCDTAFHTHCLTPPLSEVPAGDWFCPKCI